MRLSAAQKARFGQALSTDQQSKIDATIERTHQIEGKLKSYIEWTSEDVVQIQFNALGQVLDVQIDESVFGDDHTTRIALQACLVRVFDKAFRGSAKLRTIHTTNIVDMYLPGGGKHDDTSGA